MLTSFTVENFRCFKKLTIEPLERLNLIGGTNNVGKTTLLEAIYLHFGLNSLELPLMLNYNRGIEENNLNLEEICGWLFYEKEVNDSIHTIASYVDRSSELHLKLVNSKETGVYPFLPTRLLNKGLGRKELELKYKSQHRETTIWRISLAPEEERLEQIRFALKVETGKMEILPPLIFLETDNVSSSENIERYSKLEETRKDIEIIETLKLLEPRLQKLSILVTSGVPTIYADINMSHLVPLPLFGEGMGRLLSIVLAIANAPGGIVLIDEIENGLHHSVLVKVWQAIADAARRADTQVFATTHSLECIRAAHQAFSSSDRYDFRYHRLERVPDGIKAITYDREAIETSTEMNLEMR